MKEKNTDNITEKNTENNTEKAAPRITPRWVIIKITGLLFALYSAFYIFVIVRDIKILPTEGVFISALVSFLFSVLAAYAWTSEVRNIKFRVVRRVVFIVALLTVFALRLRLMDRVLAFFDFSRAETVMYGVSYFLTLGALLIIFFYYTFVRQSFQRYRKLTVVLMIISIVLLVCSFVLEIVLFFVFGIGLEANQIRTVTSRPVFYLGFIGLCVNYLFPLREGYTIDFRTPDDSELINTDDSEYIAPERDEPADPDETVWVKPDSDEYIPPEGSTMPRPDDGGFIMNAEDVYNSADREKGIKPDESGFIMNAEDVYNPADRERGVKPDDSGFIMNAEDVYNPADREKEVKPDDSGFIMNAKDVYNPADRKKGVKPDDSGFIMHDNG